MSCLFLFIVIGELKLDQIVVNVSETVDHLHSENKRARGVFTSLCLSIYLFNLLNIWHHTEVLLLLLLLFFITIAQIVYTTDKYRLYRYRYRLIDIY